MAFERTAGAPPVGVRYVASADESVSMRRISWGAIIAGTVAALAMHILLSLLGLAIGASTIDPVHGETPEAFSLGLGAGLWWTGSALIAIFIGGWVSGRLSGDPVREDGALHGFVTWGLSTVLTFYLLTTALGGILGGAFNTIGSLMQGAAAQATAGRVTDTGAEGNSVWQGIDSQIEQLLTRASVSPMAPTTSAVNQVVADEQLRTTIQRVVITNSQQVSSSDREAAINGLVTKTGMTRSQAEEQLSGWQSNYQQAEQTAREAGQKAAEDVTRAATWLVIALALGAVGGAVGGMLGAPRRLLVSR